MKAIIIAILLALIVLVSSQELSYDSGLAINPDYVLDSAGIDKENYVQQLNTELKSTKDYWAKGDSYLALARLENKTEYYKLACDNFLKYSPKSTEENALLYETLASLNCRGTRIHDLREAAHYWKILGVYWRAELLDKMADNKKMPVKFETSEITPKINLSSASKIIIGKTKIEVKNGDKIITQVDRVLRDWLGLQLNQNPFKGNILKTFSERLTYSKEELREDIGWHEGGRLIDLKNKVDVKYSTAVGTLVANKNGKWFATDEKGIFSFEVPLDKVSYPTTRFLSNDLAVVVDSHGVNMLVEQAIRKNADVIMACCDSPGKIKAAEYLSGKGISVICFTDLNLYLALGSDSKIIGSPAFGFKDGKMIYGDRPIEIKRNEKIVVTNADIGQFYGIWYYTAPHYYFNEINKTFPLNLSVVFINSFNQTDKVYEKARAVNANIVASRVFNSYDYNQAKEWLEESKDNKLILFHSASYPYGVLISQEFPEQIGFDDPNIIS